MVEDGVWQAGHTVVTVPQDLDAKTSVLLQTPETRRSQTERKQAGSIRWARAGVFTLAMSSNLPKSLFSTATSSSGEHELASLVKPTMSAYKMLRKPPTTVSHTREAQKHAGVASTKLYI